MIFYTDGQVFEHRSPKQSYIAVIAEQHERDCEREDEKLISFIGVGYKSAHDTEGLAILHALQYIEKNSLLFSMIYTDSLTWAGIANENHKVRGTKPARLYTKQIADAILLLKHRLHIGIMWKSRKVNKAGKFLGKVWGLKQAERDILEMEVNIWKDLETNQSAE